MPNLPDDSRFSLYTYDVFGLDGGILAHEGARREATKLLDSLLEMRSKDSKVREWHLFA